MNRKKRRTDAERGLNQVYASYKHDAYRRNYFWGLTLEDFKALATCPCSYCGKAAGQRSWGFHFNGLDRKDNKKGYHVRNVVPCCTACNQVKGVHLSFEEMRVAMKAVLKLRRR